MFESDADAVSRWNFASPVPDWDQASLKHFLSAGSFTVRVVEGSSKLF